MTTTAGYIIAGDAAIFSIGATPEQALAAYIKDTGDDRYDLDTISTNYRGGHIYLAPASQELLARVAEVGGAITWDHDRHGVAILPVEN